MLDLGELQHYRFKSVPVDDAQLGVGCRFHSAVSEIAERSAEDGRVQLSASHRPHQG